MNSKFLILSFFFATNIGVALAQAHGSGGSGGGGGTNVIQERSATRSASSTFTVLVQIRDNTGHEVAYIDSEQFQYYAQLLAPGRYTLIYTTKEGYIIARTEFFVE